MLDQLSPFLIHWAITALSLWVASHIFRGVKFDSTGALVVSALLLGFANAIVKPRARDVNRLRQAATAITPTVKWINV